VLGFVFRKKSKSTECSIYKFDFVFQMEADDMPHDIATAMRSELAALQYKKDRLQAEVCA